MKNLNHKRFETTYLFSTLKHDIYYMNNEKIFDSYFYSLHLCCAEISTAVKSILKNNING